LSAVWLPFVGEHILQNFIAASLLMDVKGKGKGNPVTGPGGPIG